MEGKKRKLPDWMLSLGTEQRTSNAVQTAVTPSSGLITKYFSPVKKSSPATGAGTPLLQGRSEQQQVVYILSPVELEAVAHEFLSGDV
jgi:hypothetical protein